MCFSLCLLKTFLLDVVTSMEYRACDPGANIQLNHMAIPVPVEE